MKGKQGLIIVGVIVVALVALGYFLFGKSAGLPGTGTSTFTSIQDALSRNVSLKCEYTDEQGNTTVAYIKGGAIRGDTVSQDPNKSMSYIFKDNTMYSWNPNTKEGMMMKTPEVKEEDVEGIDKMEIFDDPVEDLEQYRESCAPQVAADSLFVPPSDVDFVDFSNMMQEAPEDEIGAPQMNEEQMQRLMDQYGGEQ